MDSATGGLIGGIVGTVIGIAGGAVGTYFSIRNTNTAQERRFMVKAARLMWLAAVIFLAVLVLTILGFLPQWAFWVMMGVWFILLGPAIMWTNKGQSEIRRQSGDT